MFDLAQHDYSVENEQRASTSAQGTEKADNVLHALIWWFDKSVGSAFKIALKSFRG